ncbi:MAG: hypothetical protein SGCHY_003699, partial [Lobulomycetales sp.]
MKTPHPWYGTFHYAQEEGLAEDGLGLGLRVPGKGARENESGGSDAPLLHAVTHNNLQGVAELLASPDVSDFINVPLIDCYTPLHLASSRGFEPVVALLLQKGADPRLQDAVGETALYKACTGGHTSTVTTLLHADPSVASIPDQDAFTPLHQASALGHVKVVQILLEILSKLPELPLDSQATMTPLMLASGKGRVDIVSALLASPFAFLECKTLAGESAYDFAAQAGNAYICKLLLQADRVHGAGGVSFMEMVHETQVYSLMSRKYSPESWIDAHTQSPCTLNAVPLPENWYWLTEWAPDTSFPDVDDEEGFFPLPSSSFIPPVWKRCRRWVRTRRKRAEFADGYLSRARDIYASGRRDGRSFDMYMTVLQLLMDGIPGDENVARKKKAMLLVQELLVCAEEARSAAEEEREPPPQAPPFDSFTSLNELLTDPADIPATNSQVMATELWQLDDDVSTCPHCSNRMYVAGADDPEVPVRVCDACFANESLAPSPLRQRFQTSDTSEDMERSMRECPVCGLAFETEGDSEAHLLSCLDGQIAAQESGRTSRVVGTRYVVFTLVRNEGGDGGGGGECSICFEEFEHGNRVARMNCLCVFHAICLEVMLLEKILNLVLRTREPSELLRLKRSRRLVSYLSLILSKPFLTLLLCVALAVLAALPLPQLAKNIYFDENALLTNDPARFFSHKDAVRTIVYKDASADFISSSDHLGRAQFYSRKFSELGLDSETFPFSYAKLGTAPRLNGTSTYAIMRSPRSDGTEAILLTAPFSCMNGEANLHGTSVLLSMAAFIKQFNHWSKDVIFLFSDHTTIGTQAWLQAYHGEFPGAGQGLDYPLLNYHAGEIREAITIDLPGLTDYTHLGLYAQGLNGQQANADIVT